MAIMPNNMENIMSKKTVKKVTTTKKGAKNVKKGTKSKAKSN